MNRKLINTDRRHSPSGISCPGTWTAVSVYRGGSARASRVVFGALAEHSFRSARAPTGAAEAAALPARFGDWRPDRADKAVRAPIRNPQCASAGRLTSWETSVRSVEPGLGVGSSRWHRCWPARAPASTVPMDRDCAPRLSWRINPS